MLVLSRHENERILIGSEVDLMVVSIDGNRVRLGIEAPKHVEILRAELAGSERATPRRRIDVPKMVRRLVREYYTVRDTAVSAGLASGVDLATKFQLPADLNTQLTEYLSDAG
jgi:carbon storage regulator